MNTSLSSNTDNRLAVTNAAAAAAISRSFSNPNNQSQRPSIATLAQNRQSYAQPQQSQQPKQTSFTARSHSTATAVRNPNTNSTLQQQIDRSQQQHQRPPHQGTPYSVASSGRGFIHRPLRPQPSDHTVTVANPGAYPSRPVMTFPNQVARPLGYSNSESLNQPVHMIAPPYVQHPNFGITTGPTFVPIRGIPVSAHPKIASSPSVISDSNGYKDVRERSKEGPFVIIRDRKVRTRNGASLYALCRSWLRNGSQEESQVRNEPNPLRIPLPMPVPVFDIHLPTRKEADIGEENEGSLEDLSSKELLKRHIKRAKKVRARLREARTLRIARYKLRLATLLPAQEHFTDDTADSK